eukprot:TRINITY_DN30826_c0_g1_i2.p1 TRINITY_DN30826_c0_g1~~TRINITY_DN30826_c0_g1_i2.p1  ORF type:complete len:298 (-),score=41.71 TRINITY_DN30826_c0_g1_i2:98-991(-)
MGCCESTCVATRQKSELALELDAPTVHGSVLPADELDKVAPPAGVLQERSVPPWRQPVGSLAPLVDLHSAVSPRAMPAQLSPTAAPPPAATEESSSGPARAGIRCTPHAIAASCAGPRGLASDLTDITTGPLTRSMLRAGPNRRRGPRTPFSVSGGLVGVGPMMLPPALVRLQFRDVTPEDYDLLCSLDDTVPKRDRVPRSLVAQLPVVPSCDCEGAVCPVCLCDLLPNSQVVRLPCLHAFHSDCLSRWLTQCKGTCPLCTLPIGDDDSKPPALERIDALRGGTLTSELGEDQRLLL